MERRARKAPRTMGFSFTRRDSDPDRARSDLAAAVEIIAAAEEVEQALDDATERLKRDLTDEAFEEQQRLIAGAARIKTEAGVSLPAPIKRRNNMAKNETQERRNGRSGRCPADRPQRRVDQEDDRPRQEARRRHLSTSSTRPCPQDQMSSEQIEDIMSALTDMGINVVENDEDSDDDDEDKEPEPRSRTRSIRSTTAAPAPRRRPRRKPSTAPTTRSACTCARWARSNCSPARARSPSPSASRPAATR